jgi:hydrogenase maturation protease
MRHDDGVGAAVIQWLTAEASLPSDVELLDAGMPRPETVLLFQEFHRLILIDAADLGLDVGDWVRIPLSPSQFHSRSEKHLSNSHAFGLAEALNIGHALNLLPPVILFYGVQPGDLSWSYGLSEEVKQAVPTICNNIVNVLQGGFGRGDCMHGEMLCPPEFRASSVTINTVQI